MSVLVVQRRCEKRFSKTARRGISYPLLFALVTIAAVVVGVLMMTGVLNLGSIAGQAKAIVISVKDLHETYFNIMWQNSGTVGIASFDLTVKDPSADATLLSVSCSSQGGETLVPPGAAVSITSEDVISGSVEVRVAGTDITQSCQVDVSGWSQHGKPGKTVLVILKVTYTNGDTLVTKQYAQIAVG